MKKITVLITTIVLLATFGFGKSLRIGVASGAISMDPYGINETATISILSNLFDTLVSFDKDLKIRPNLAMSWSNPEPTIWIMNLRHGVKFSNGADFSADDVVYSFDRMKNWKKSGFKGKVSAISSCEKINNYAVKFTTIKPFPVFLRKLTYLNIMSKKTIENKSDEWVALNPVGTGPYKLVAWSKGDYVRMSANENYWAGKPTYDKVVFRPLTNDATRVAAILSKEVDIINRVPVVDVKRVKNSSDLNFFIQPGLRLIFLMMDQDRDNSPFIKSPTGKNPLKDIRVRKAIYYAIDENAIVKYIMKGFAKPAGQLSPKAVFGHDPSIKREKYNLAKAKKLLNDAGYPNGFDIVLDSPNNRYINDAQIAQAVASSLAKIGIRVKVNATPKSTFFAETGKLNTSFFLLGWSNSDGDQSSIFDGCIHSYDAKKGYGRYNRGRFSNSKVDALIEQSDAMMVPKERLKALREAQKIALVDNQCFIPLHFQVDIYAASKKVKFKPRTDSRIWVFDIK